jgi:hypothetical protein
MLRYLDQDGFAERHTIPRRGNTGKAVSTMLLRLMRSQSKHHVTFGTLFVDDVMECFTLAIEIRNPC